jgi:hypothetical protein
MNETGFSRPHEVVELGQEDLVILPLGRKPGILVALEQRFFFLEV